jgi:hypothetical protein
VIIWWLFWAANITELTYSFVLDLQASTAIEPILDDPTKIDLSSIFPTVADLRAAYSFELLFTAVILVAHFALFRLLQRLRDMQIAKHRLAGVT